MVLFGRASDPRTDAILNSHHHRNSSSSASSAIFIPSRKDSTSSTAKPARGLSKKPSASSLFSLSRLNSRASDTSSAWRSKRDGDESSIASELPCTSAKAARILGLDQPEPESFAKAWMRRGRNLKRHASKLSLSSSNAPFDDRDDNTSRSTRNNSLTGSEYLEVRRTPSISYPSNFQHVTHTRPNHFDKLNTVNQNDLVAEFSALRAGQQTHAHVRGFKVAELRSEVSSLADRRKSTDSASTNRTAMSPTPFIEYSLPPDTEVYKDAQFFRPGPRQFWNVRRSALYDRQPTSAEGPASSQNSVDGRFSPAADGWDSHSPYIIDGLLPPVDEEEPHAVTANKAGFNGSQQLMPSPYHLNVDVGMAMSTCSTQSNQTATSDDAPRASLDMSNQSVTPMSSFEEANAPSATVQAVDKVVTVKASTSAAKPRLIVPIDEEPPSGSPMPTSPAESSPTSVIKKPLKSILKTSSKPLSPTSDNIMRSATHQRPSPSVSFEKVVGRGSNFPRGNMSVISSIPKPKSDLIPPRHAKVQAELDSLQQILSKLESDAEVRTDFKGGRRPLTEDFSRAIGPEPATHRKQKSAEARINFYAAQALAERDVEQTTSPARSQTSLGGNEQSMSPSTILATPQPRPSKRVRHDRAMSTSSEASSRTSASPKQLSRIPIATHRRTSSSASFNYSLFPSPPQTPPPAPRI